MARSGKIVAVLMSDSISEACVKAIYFEEHGGIDDLISGSPGTRARPRWSSVRLGGRRRSTISFLYVLPGWMPGFPIGLPHIGGADGAGVWRLLGAGVESVDVGAEVVFDPGLSCGRCAYSPQRCEQSLCVRFGVLGEHNDGTLAETVVVAADSLAPRPSHLSWAESAAFGLTFLTSWRMLINRGGFAPVRTVLIHGIGGGVSLACLQLASSWAPGSS